MKALIFPALIPGAPTGDALPVRLTRHQRERLGLIGERLDVRSKEGGNHTLGALVRAIADGALVVTRADAPAAPAADVVHRGCPTD